MLVVGRVHVQPMSNLMKTAMFLPLLRTLLLICDPLLGLLFSDTGCRSCQRVVEIDDGSDTDLPEISS